MRYYSSIAIDTTLSAGVNAAATSLTVGGIVGYPASFPFTLVVDPDTAVEELVEVSGYSGNTFTVTRGVDGTTAVSHATGAIIRHAVSGRDFREPQTHIAATSGVHGVTGPLASGTALSAHTGAATGVHGVTGSVVGTSDAQTLTNKTIDYNSNTITNLPGASNINYQLLNAGGTSLVGVSSVTVSGISGMNRLLLVVTGAKTSTSGYPGVSFLLNGGGPWSISRNDLNSTTPGSTTYLATPTFPMFTLTTSNTGSSMMFVDGTASSGIKPFNYTAALSDTGSLTSSGTGFCGASAVTSAALLGGATFTAGTFYVYGA